MAKLKRAFDDPFVVDPPPEPSPPEPAPDPPVPDPVTAEPVTKPARVQVGEPAGRNPNDLDEGTPPLYVRQSPAMDQWLRRIRFEQRIVAAAMVRALVRLAMDDAGLAERAMTQARADATRERPGPKRAPG